MNDDGTVIAAPPGSGDSGRSLPLGLGTLLSGWSTLWTGVKTKILAFLASLYLIIFIVVWCSLILRTMGFHATADQSTPSFAMFTVSAAGFLATSVAAFAASLLGIEIQKPTGSNLSARAKNAFTNSGLLTAYVLAYIAIGIWAFLVAIFKTTGTPETSASPEIVQSLGMSLLGFLAGAAAAFMKADGPSSPGAGQ